MATKTLPDQDVLWQLLDYCPESGRLTWRERLPEHFNETPGRAAEDICVKWNTRRAGTAALGSIPKSGYCTGHLLGAHVKAHRVIYKMIHGEEPEFIDHINGNRADNRIENLRPVTLQDNAKNRRMNASNQSGAAGVQYSPRLRKWVAAIGVGAKNKHIGVYNCFTAALIARKLAEQKYDFHPNHGRAA